MNIRLSRVFIGSKQERVEELVLVDADTLIPLSDETCVSIGENLALYFGTAFVQMMGLNPNGEPFPLPPQEITFPIEAKNRIEAFDKFESSANAYLNFLRAESEKERRKADLLVPNADEVGRFGNSLKLSH